MGDGLRSEGGPVEALAGCIACGGALAFLPDSYPLAFHCENGHFFTLSDLLDEALHQGKDSGDTARIWTGKARLLRDLAARALQLRNAFTAADFHEAAERIDGWVSKLSALLSRGDASPAPPD